MEEIYKRRLRAAQAAAKKDFIHRAKQAGGFTVDQAEFLWNFLITSETMKKMMNLVEHIQKEKDFKM